MTTLVYWTGGVLLITASVMLILALVLIVQVIAARRPSDSPSPRKLTHRPSVAVLMPAHNEAAGIAVSIRSLLPQLRADDRLLVVADNCDDATAALATALGVQVVERFDTVRRGKGYALDFGVRHLERGDSPEVVVIVDADCELHEGALDRLARQCVQSGRPVQALYLMRAPSGSGLKTRIAEFAWVVRNQVRPLGWHRLGLPCQLMGTGMAFPWESIQTAVLASGHIVEDMQLGLDMANAGTPPVFCSQALVTSVFPLADAGIVAQRTRWEHGHLGMIGSRALPMLVWALIKRQPHLAAMALDLCVPPLASLALLLIMTLLGGALLLVGGIQVPFVLSLLAVALFVVAIGIAWHRFARHIVSFAELLSVPRYILAKIPIYVRLFTKRQIAWVRSERGDAED